MVSLPRWAPQVPSGLKVFASAGPPPRTLSFVTLFLLISFSVLHLFTYFLPFVLYWSLAN